MFFKFYSMIVFLKSLQCVFGRKRAMFQLQKIRSAVCVDDD